MTLQKIKNEYSGYKNIIDVKQIVIKNISKDRDEDPYISEH